MKTMRQEIQIAAKLYSCQKAAQILYKDDYLKEVKWYKDVLTGIMKKENIDELKAALFVLEMEIVKDNPGSVMMFMAAAVELIEPSPHS